MAAILWAVCAQGALAEADAAGNASLSGAQVLAQAAKDAEEGGAASGAGKITGFLESRTAYTYDAPSHWSKGLFRLQLGSEGKITEGLSYKITGQLDYDAVYDSTSFYPHDVRADQRREFQWRETYLDTSAGDWEFRFGRQHIVWGEMVGLFFADVVSAKDMREFVLPDFDAIRIPQWAARAEYFKDDSHLELIWIPYASYDNIGKPGAEFYPYPPNLRSLNVLGDEQPGHSLNNSNFGLRANTIKNGWDMAGFVYRSHDAAPVLAYDPAVRAYRPQHDHITQTGATLAKDFDSFVLKAEAVYTRGRRYFTNDVTSPTGLVSQNVFTYVAGLEFTLPADTNFNVQLFDNAFLDRDPNLFFSHHEAGMTLLLRHNFRTSLSAEALFIRSLNRDDWMLQPSVKWSVDKNWRLSFGVDVFDGPMTGYFGRYRDRDRVYTDLRYTF
jgi:hypothetical protein